MSSSSTTPQEAPVGAAPGGKPAKSLKSFAYLNALMFQGAFSDNVYKLLVIFYGLALARASAGASGVAGDELAKLETQYTAIAGAAFIAPYMIVPTFAGSISDKFSKARVTLWTKLLEVAVMAFAVAMFAIGSFWGSVAVLFFMGMQSALFSPAKYGILPELVSEERVGWANGVLQGATFLAIILGTLAGPMLFAATEDGLWVSGLVLVGLAMLGSWFGWMIEKTPAAAPDLRLSWNPLPEVTRYMGEILRHPGLTLAVAGLTIWWLVVSALQPSAILMASNTLGLSLEQTGMALVPIVIGIGIGCFFAGRMSRERIELGLVPVGALGMFLGGLAVYWLEGALSPEAAMYGVPLAMGIVGFMAGLFVVPLQSYVIQTADPAVRGGVWAAQNFVTAFGMVLGQGMLWVLGGKLGYTPADIFLAMGMLMLVTCVFVCVRLPEIPLRFKVMLIFNTFYRVRVRGVENIPAEGGALLVGNHQSFLDGIIMSAAIRRRTRFIMSDDYVNRWYIWPFAKYSDTIPLSGSMTPKEIILALREAGESIKRGDLIMIFAEGQITRHGNMLPLRRGYEKIIEGTGCPVIPVAIDGVWGSAFSPVGGFLQALRLRIGRRPINVSIGRPMPDSVQVHELRQAIQENMVDAFAMRRDEMVPLHRMAVRELRRGPFKPFAADLTNEVMLPRIKVLTAAIVLARRLKPVWGRDEFVGVMLPPSIGGMAVNLGALLAGRVPVNLNYTLPGDGLAKIIEKTGMRNIITSREFIEKLAERNDLRPHMLPDGAAPWPGVTVTFLDEVRKHITGGERISALLAALFKPVDSIERELGRERPAAIDDLATLIFSSGSTGDPKGVMLSHWNVKSNSVAAAQVIPFDEDDALLGILPFFHSFGFMATLWLPLIRRVKVVFFPSPLDARGVGHCIAKHGVTHMLATPTFLQGYARRIPPDQLGSVKVVLTGAEKLRKNLADEFEERFGVRPMEGYGATETSPVVAVNTFNIRRRGVYQVGNREGYIGHPLPGVAVRIVDPETFQVLPPNEPGMVIVRGANVMQGYYRDEKRSAEVLRDGWYVTGDIAKMDIDGFIMITDRLSRFSKIGGEMVPHIKIEEALQDLAQVTERVFAVTGVPDERKGERLVVLYSCAEDAARAAAEALAASGQLPNLWIPKFSDFVRIDEMPILGSGKLDLTRVKAMAFELTREKADARS